MSGTKYQEHFYWGNKVVLIAEDEKINFVLLRSVFENSNATVIWAQDGEEALEVFKKAPQIDLVIVDYIMPKLNGIEVARCIREYHSSIPVIFQSSNYFDKKTLNSVSYNNIAYFQKPVNPFQILSAAEDMLRK